MRIFFISFMCFVFSAIAQVHASDNSPQTNRGGVFKVPVEKIDEVDRATEKWANWIKETHPLGPDDENNLASLSITRSLPQAGYVYYVIVEIYPTPEGLKNHQKIYRETSWKSEYSSTFSDFGSTVMRYLISGSKQKHTVYHLVPSKDH
jgi:hypothetical protein